MQIALLGPLEVRDDAGAAVAVSGGRLRALLARLAVETGRPVRPDALVDAVWGARPPAEAANALQTLVSRLRRALGADAIAQSPAGYRLVLDPEDLDATRFERWVTEGQAALAHGEPARARDLLMRAAALWRGAPFADVGEPGVALDAHARRLTDLHLAARVDLAEADLQLGSADVAALDVLVTENPLHEPLTGQLMRALGANGRQADALHAYEALRVRLADALGVDPSPVLQQLHLDLLRGEFAAPGAPPGARSTSRRTNLKSQLSSFVGREDEVTRIAKSLEQGRLVTLVGPGGAGKTRLAAESARRILDTAPDGVWLAELATVTAGGDVAQAVLGSIGSREVHLIDPERGDRSGGVPRDAMSRLVESLADKSTLLVLDNCEHVIDASARLAEQLLGDCPDLRILATSREPLGIFGEALLAVPPLGRPAPTADADEALEFPAVRLFADRAAAVQPDFAVDRQTVADVVEIVRRLDGLPLAIELAAARLRTMPVADVAARLSDRFRLLTGGSRTALPRHRTLRAVVAWSWDLLTDAERRMAAQLSVFPAGVTLSSATAVRPDDTDEYEVADLLASLVDKSLLQPVGDGRRTRMLETIREYASERLAEQGVLVQARERHARHFQQLLAEAVPHLVTAGQLPWFELLRAEQENILAAMRYCCDIGDADAALGIGVDLASFAMMLGRDGESAAWLGEALAVPGGDDEQLRLVARATAAISAMGGGPADGQPADIGGLRSMAHELAAAPITDIPIATVLRPALAFLSGEEELAGRLIADTLAHGDAWSRAVSWMFRASLAENVGDIPSMRENVAHALAAFRAIGERWGLASTLRNLAQLRTLDGDLEGAAAAYAEAMELMRELDSDDDEVLLRGRLADLALRRGDVEEARRHAEIARESADITGSSMESVFTLTLLGEIERRVGNDHVAREMIERAMQRLALMPHEHPARGHVRAMVTGLSARMTYEDHGPAPAAPLARQAFEAAVGTNDLPIVASVGVLIAELTAASGDAVRAAEQLGAAARLRGADDPTDSDVAATTARARGVLGDVDFERAYRRGRELPRDEAIARLDPG